MRNSRVNLIIGIIWFPMWIYHFYRWYYIKGLLFEGILELTVLLPLGFSFLYDWFHFGMKGLPNFVEQRSWNLADYGFWLTGVFGAFSVLAGVVFLNFKEDPILTGIVGVSISLIHTMRRRVFMGRSPF